MLSIVSLAVKSLLTNIADKHNGQNFVEAYNQVMFLVIQRTGFNKFVASPNGLDLVSLWLAQQLKTDKSIKSIGCCDEPI